MKGGRRLTGEDLALWRYAVRAVRPRPGRMALAEPSAIAAKPEPKATPLPAKPRISTAPAAPAMPPRPAVPATLPLERRERLELKRGKREVDAVLDLHGLTQDAAHAALRRFLFRQQDAGARHVLVITGKGGSIGGGMSGASAADLFAGRGILKRMVPHWLRGPDLRPVVLAFEEAGHRHGGAGALYLRLRRERSPS